MLRSLFRIFARPQVTLDELLEEKRGGRSWGATILLVVTNVVATLLLGIFAFHKVTDLAEQFGSMSRDYGTMMALTFSFAFFMLYSLGWALIQFVFGRFMFGWIVQLGLRMVAGPDYPRDRETRREKAKLVRLIHPYTRWMSELPSVVSLLALSLVIALVKVPADLNALSQAQIDQWVLSLLVVFLILAILTALVTFGFWIYMIVVRTIAIQKIYRMSAAKAFWGPFIPYAILYFLYMIAYVIYVIISITMGGHAPQNDINLM
ncbi:MAG: hypothetical protein ACXVP5_08820 [Tumebacillaceae bacterium]